MVALVLSTTTGSNWMLFAKSNTLRLSLRCLWMCLCQSDFRNLCVSTRPSPRCLLGPRRHKTQPCRRVQHPGTEHDIANGQKWVEHCMHPTPPVVPPQVRYDWTRQWHPPRSRRVRKFRVFFVFSDPGELRRLRVVTEPGCWDQRYVRAVRRCDKRIHDPPDLI